MNYYKLYTDGACRGNGNKNSQCGIGCVIYDTNNQIVSEISEYIGKGKTNNESEYLALIRGLDECINLQNVNRLDVYVDSKLVCEQVRGNYRVNKEGLVGLCKSVRDKLNNFDVYTIQNIPRSQNKRADKLANEAIDSYNKKTSRTIDKYFG